MNQISIEEILQVPNVDALVKSRKSTTDVIPAKAGIQKYHMVTKALDPGFRRGDDFLRSRQCWGTGQAIYGAKCSNGNMIVWRHVYS